MWVGVLAMIDDGETDWKVLCIDVDDVLAPQLDDIEDLASVQSEDEKPNGKHPVAARSFVLTSFP